MPSSQQLNVPAVYGVNLYIGELVIHCDNTIFVSSPRLLADTLVSYKSEPGGASV